MIFITCFKPYSFKSNDLFSAWLLQWLIDTGRKYINTMVTKIAETSNKFNRQICLQYDNIVKRTSYQAENTRELVELIDYVERLKCGEMLQLLVGFTEYFVHLY